MIYIYAHISFYPFINYSRILLPIKNLQPTSTNNIKPFFLSILRSQVHQKSIFSSPYTYQCVPRCHKKNGNNEFERIERNWVRDGVQCTRRGGGRKESGGEGRQSGREEEEEGFERAGNDAFPYRSLSSPPALPPPSHTPMYYCPTVNFARKAI